MKVAPWIVLGLALVACGEDGGEDVLPKRGERAADPTIVSATASCVTETGTMTFFEIRVAASDPAGQANLGTATVEINGMSDVDAFGSGSAGTSYHVFEMACVKGTSYTVNITVANETGGFTTASTSVIPN